MAAKKYRDGESTTDHGNRIGEWTLPAVLHAQNRDAVVEASTKYFIARRADPRYPRFPGGMFERLGGGGREARTASADDS